MLALAACGAGAETQAAGAEGSAQQVTVEHAQGSTTVTANPQKVVVFDTSALLNLHDLGIPVVGVPELTDLPEHLAKYAGDEYTKVGSLFEPDYEKVNSLAPDLIIVAGRSSSVYPELAKIAPTVDLTVDSADFLNSFRARTEALGKIFGKDAEVKQRLDAVNASIEEVKAKADDRKGLIVLTTGGKVSAHGPGGRFGIVHDVLGVQPAADGLKTDTHGNAISHEFIAEKNPDLLYVVDRDAVVAESGQAAKQVLDNELVNGTNAAKNDKIVYLDPFTWYLAPNAMSSVENMVKTIGDSLT
ncbi:siderophore ABC transporter substrate-binding protein [Nonomuraea terrae]|uniref:siderophore ABC transporter substrate-binding protein n=1 Tax=Nonomuraea terrae TaxID=2530383 RepID=UPI0037991C89